MNRHNDHPIPLCGLVLAGGGSSRMGRDKASLRHPDGRPLGLRAFALLAEAGCESVALSLRAGQELPDGFSMTSPPAVIRDPEGASDGPLAGILAAMRTRPDADWLVVACDLPRLDLPTLAALIGARVPGERFLAFRSEHDGLPEPLCAVYARESVHLLEAMLAGGMRCPRNILLNHDCRLLESVSPRALDNANTPDQWESTVKP